MEQTNKSECARLRERITLEYEAAKRVLTNFTPTAQHTFITKRQENIEKCFADLKEYMTPQEAMTVLVEIETQVHASGSSGNTS